MAITKDRQGVDILMLGTLQGRIKLFEISSMSKRGVMVAHNQVRHACEQ